MNAQYERTAVLLSAEHCKRQADLAHEYGLSEEEKIFRDTIGRLNQLADFYRRALIGGK